MPAAWTTRFAPSPTGRLHLGHVFAAVVARDHARASGGRFLLRHEDIDGTRCRPEFILAAEEELRWLGLDWDGPAVVQSSRLAGHAAALAQLDALGVIYPCFCTRREIQEEIARSGGAPQGPDGPVYPGTCRHLSPAEREEKSAAARASGPPPALRLDMARALALAADSDGPLEWQDLERGIIRADPGRHGDVVLARKDAGTSYHLAVTVDDAWQGITLVTRSEDLFASTHIHRLLQTLLGLPVPVWHHHRLVCDTSGRRLAKRHDALAVATLRHDGWSPDRVLASARA